MSFMETAYGPTVKARQRLTGEGRWQDCRAEMLALAERRNEATDGSLLHGGRVPDHRRPQGRLTCDA